MSIPANIVEGREQKSEAAFGRYLRISLSSASELEQHLTMARDIGALTTNQHTSLAGKTAEVRMMLHGLLRRIEAPKNDSHSPAQDA